MSPFGVSAMTAGAPESIDKVLFTEKLNTPFDLFVQPIAQLKLPMSLSNVALIVLTVLFITELLEEFTAASAHVPVIFVQTLQFPLSSLSPFQIGVKLKLTCLALEPLIEPSTGATNVIVITAFTASIIKAKIKRIENKSNTFILPS